MAAKKGRFDWYDLMTTDLGAARSFYTAVVGWKITKWEQAGYEMWTVGEQAIGGMMALPDEAKKVGTPPHWLYYVSVDDVDAAIARVQQHGGKVLNGPMEVPGGDKIAQCMDPQGGYFALHMPAKA